MEGTSRRPSQPVMYPRRSSSVDRGMSSSMLSRNSKHFGHGSDSDRIGSDAAASRPVVEWSENLSSPLRAGSTSRPARSVLRNLTPTDPELEDDWPRPKIHHVPGSYQTETGETDIDLTTPTQYIEQSYAAHDEYPWSEPIELEMANGQPKVLEAAQNSKAPMPQAAHSSSSNLPLHSIREQSSASTLKSIPSTKDARQPLQTARGKAIDHASSVERLISHRQDHDGHSQTPNTHIPESSPGFEEGNPSFSSLPTQQIVELLNKLPPLTQDMVEHLQAQYRSDSPSASTDIVASNVGNSSPSIYSRQSSIRLRARTISQKPSVGSQIPLELVHDSQDQENQFAPYSEAEIRVVVDQKPSSLDEVLTDLPEQSLRLNAGLPVVRPVFAKDSGDFRSEAARLKQSPSLPSSNDTNETTDLTRLAAQPRLYNKHSYQNPSPVVPLTGAKSPEPRLHWMRQLLGKRSLAALIEEAQSPNLTTRPGYKLKYPTVDDRAISSADTTQGREVPETPVRIQSHIKHAIEPDYSTSMPPAHLSRSESFGKVIVELESLLKEALVIAEKAADKKEQDRALEVYVQDRLDPTSTIDSSPHQQSSSHVTPKMSFERGYEAIDYAPRTSGVAKQQGSTTTKEIEPSSSPQAKFQQETLVLSGPYRTGGVPRSPSALTRGRNSHPRRAITYSPSSEHVQQIMVERGIMPQTPSMEFLHLKQEPAGLQKETNDIIRAPPDAIVEEPVHHISTKDWALPHRNRQYPEAIAQPLPRRPISMLLSTKESQIRLYRKDRPVTEAPPKEEAQKFISLHGRPPIQPRGSSIKSNRRSVSEASVYHYETNCSSSSVDSVGEAYVANFRTDGLRQRVPTHSSIMDGKREVPGIGHGMPPRQDTITSFRGPASMENPPENNHRPNSNPGNYSLKNRRHYSVRGAQGFSLSGSHRKAPIARDWSTTRKRFVAAIACINTALMGLIIGIYAGEVPAIQYAIVDENRYSILGNVVFFIGLAIPTLVFWPLPLLHGRKPYTLGALALLLALQFPQAIAVGTTRSPYVATYRAILLLSRALAGFVTGFANINFKTTLLDLFGASLMSGNPHGEMVILFDVRRHGGGMGLWLGIWTWCSIGSIGLGFTAGALIISGLQVAWGFWITILLTLAVLLLNVVTPEVRRSPYRRSMAEVHMGADVSRRIAKGEVMMHLHSTGPKYWWEEAMAGCVLCMRLLMQPGFVVLSLYLSWIYGQVVMIIILLGALTSKYYLLQPEYVGLCVAAIPLGALLAIPFQKASLFSRARHHPPRTDSMTFEKRVTWTSHLVRRVIFMIILPFAGLAYTLASGGPQIPIGIPVLFAGVIGFLSNLAIAECNGIIMETYDTSDLQPGMTGRPRRIVPENLHRKRTNFSCFPRVSAAFAITQTFAFIIAAAATGTGGRVERALGAQTATAVVASVLLVLTVLLVAVLVRFKVVQVVPTARVGTNVLGGPEDEWKPIIIGNPSGTTRRMSLLELGRWSRWSEIRRRNRLIKD